MNMNYNKAMRLFNEFINSSVYADSKTCCFCRCVINNTNDHGNGCPVSAMLEFKDNVLFDRDFIEQTVKTRLTGLQKYIRTTTDEHSKYNDYTYNHTEFIVRSIDYISNMINLPKKIVIDDTDLKIKIVYDFPNPEDIHSFSCNVYHKSKRLACAKFNEDNK